ncbi:MAG: hypothetical protein ACRDOK_25600 [Streptosporangiaceae bacterium]
MSIAHAARLDVRGLDEGGLDEGGLDEGGLEVCVTLRGTTPFPTPCREWFEARDRVQAVVYGYQHGLVQRGFAALASRQPEACLPAPTRPLVQEEVSQRRHR